MSTDKKERRSGLASENRKSENGATRSRPRTGRERDIGQALRSIYQKTVDEAVPSEMLDLLGKLG